MLANLVALGLTVLSLGAAILFVLGLIGGALWLARQLDRQLAGP